MSLIDVETTAEAIQEDEELIEAVESLVETAAFSLKFEIETAIRDFWHSLIEGLEWIFPLWVAYKQDGRLFWDDLQKFLFSLFLVAISFWVLAPSSSRSRLSELATQQRRRQQQQQQQQRASLAQQQGASFADLRSFRSWFQQSTTRGTDKFNSSSNNNTINLRDLRRQSSIEIKPGSFSTQPQHPKSTSMMYNNNMDVPRRPSSLCSGRIITTGEEETDQERFEKIYSRLARSSYSRLVLPPECQLVAKHKRSSTIKEAINSNFTTGNSSNINKEKLSNTEKAKQRRKKRDRGDEDQPYNRLIHYAYDVFNLFKSFASYDYMGMGWTLITWLEALLRLRKLRRSSNHPEIAEDDDDDDDESKTSVSNVATISGTGANASLANSRDQSLQQKQQQLYSDVSSQSLPVHDGNNSMQGEGEEQKVQLSLLDGVSNSDSSNVPVGQACIQKTKVSKRRNSETEFFSTPSQHSMDLVAIGETDEATMSALRLPTPGGMPSCKAQSGSIAQLRPSLTCGKKKDLLENYRSSTPSLAGSAPPGLNSPSTSSFVSRPVPENSTLSREITSIHRNHDKFDADALEESFYGEAPQGRMQRMDSDFSASYYFETANTQESIHQMSIEAPLPDKNGYIVGDEFLPDSNYTPVLVFVNSRSGPQQGHLLITQLRRLLNPIQVWDLGADGGPEIVLESFCSFRNLRILVCGGDGTVSWIIATLEKLKLKRKWPPIAILPLGTGNDLARMHGWGGGYNNEPLTGILEEVADSYISLLDRWEVTIENRKGKVKDVKSFFNYLGVGADAQAALQVHMLRESKPQLFFSRIVNLAWYGVFGAEDTIKATSLNLPNEITLIADGVEVPLPPDSQGIIFLNIDSYAGGAPIWSTGTKNIPGVHGYGHTPAGDIVSSDHNTHRPRQLRRTRSLEDMGLRGNSDSGYRPMDRIDSVEDLTQVLTEAQRYDRVTACDEPSSCQDGVLEVVSIRSAFHLGQIRVGLSHAQRLCSCREATVHIKRKVAVQTDGEPWRQNVCTMKVKRKPERATMLHRSEDKNGVETEMAKLLDWAEERKLIDQNVHKTLTKEYSRRIEYKTRQRRRKAKDHNIMFSLKRAIGSTGAISSYGENYEYSG